MSESKAIKDLRSGSEAALGWFIHRYSAYVTTIIHNIIGTYMEEADVEEVAADVFLALWENAGKIHSVKGFLGATARNKAKNKLRSLGQVLPLEEDLLVLDALTPEDLLQKKELTAAVKKAISDLGQPDRDVFLRYYFYCQRMEDISTQMGIPLSTIKSKLRRGKAKLKQTLVWYLG